MPPPPELIGRQLSVKLVMQKYNCNGDQLVVDQLTHASEKRHTPAEE